MTDGIIQAPDIDTSVSQESPRPPGNTLRNTILWIAFLLVLSAFLGIPFVPRGMRVTVKNVGSTEMKAVTLHVTGDSAPAGDLRPGEFMTVRVKPQGESHLEISYENPEGEKQRLNAGGYFGKGSLGTIEVEVKNNKVSSFSNSDWLF